MNFYAVRFKSAPDHVRIEKARTPEAAFVAAFGRGAPGVDAQYKDMGSRASITRSQRVELCNNPNSWVTYGDEVTVHSSAADVRKAVAQNKQGRVCEYCNEGTDKIRGKVLTRSEFSGKRSSGMHENCFKLFCLEHEFQPTANDKHTCHLCRKPKHHNNHSLLENRKKLVTPSSRYARRQELVERQQQSTHPTIDHLVKENESPPRLTRAEMRERNKEVEVADALALADRIVISNPHADAVKVLAAEVRKKPDRRYDLADAIRYRWVRDYVVKGQEVPDFNAEGEFDDWVDSYLLPTDEGKT